MELACKEDTVGNAAVEPRSIGAFRLARASLEEPASAAAPQPIRATPPDGCKVADAHSNGQAELQQGLHGSTSKEANDRDTTVTNMDKEKDTNFPRASESRGSSDLQHEQQAPAELGRVLVERAAQEQNALHEPELAQQPCVDPSDLTKACDAASHAPCAPEPDMSPAWRRAMQCLSETGLSVFCPSKRQRLSANR